MATTATLGNDEGISNDNKGRRSNVEDQRLTDIQNGENDDKGDKRPWD
uniref:Uncharacterized protein n=1 Tax=Moniliophthora roreri TaxID=221103 RepID=A0A0W0G7Y7_MONRR